MQFVQQARHFIQVQLSNILRPTVFDDLADILLALEWIGEIEPVCAPDDVSAWRKGRHVRVSRLQMVARALLLHRYYTTVAEIDGGQSCSRAGRG